MQPRRIVVGTSPANVGEGSEPPLVGVLPWSRLHDAWCSIIVKARVSADAPDKLLAGHTFLARPAQADPLQRPVDFVPAKSIVDVLVVGHVELPGPPNAPVQAAGRLVIAEQSTLLSLEAPSPGRVPLTMQHARVQGEEGIDGAIGPMNLHDGSELSFKYPEDFAFTLYQSACRPHLLREKVPESSKIALELMVNGHAHPVCDFRMPSVSPRILLEPSQVGTRKTIVPAVLDTVLVDLDRRELELTWRGYFEALAGTRDVDTIYLGWASDEQMKTRRGWQTLLRELPHGQFRHAWFFADAESGVAPAPLSAKQEKAARLRTWMFPLAPEPRLEIDAFAEIGAELEARREPRKQILERHRLTEDAWALEERAWLERATGETRSHQGKSPTSTAMIDARVRATERLTTRLLTQAVVPGAAKAGTVNPGAKEPS